MFHLSSDSDEFTMASYVVTNHCKDIALWLDLVIELTLDIQHRHNIVQDTLSQRWNIMLSQC